MAVPKIKIRKRDHIHTHPTLETQAHKSHVVKDPMCDKPKEIREKSPKQAFFPFFGTFKLLAKATKVTSSCLFQVPKVCSSLSLSQRQKISLPLKNSSLNYVEFLPCDICFLVVEFEENHPNLSNSLNVLQPATQVDSLSLSLSLFIYIYIYCG